MAAVLSTSNGSDVVVVGGGVFGLSVAWACLKRGATVTVLEALQCGSGASGGLVGALIPHVPDRWNAKKAFQLAALERAEAGWAEVAEAGGVDAGYARVGRLYPLLTADARRLAETRARLARQHWPHSAAWEVLDAACPPLNSATAPHGAVHETLSARISPRRAVAALAAAVRAHRGAILEGWPVSHLIGNSAEGPTGRVSGNAVVLAGGAAGMNLLEAVVGRPMGRAEKGQAALLGANWPDITPVISAAGLYIVGHGDGTVAVGSTSEKQWMDPIGTDARLDDLIDKARDLCPSLAGTSILQRWAGLRPRGISADPLLGPVPGAPRLFAATGGFKTGFGMALALGEALAAEIAGNPPTYPERFLASAHLATLRVGKG